MRFWFVHSSEVTIREQIVTQVTLGILSGELAVGERLPSTRELARRFQLHANTISGAYRQLEAEGWVESRCGSGVFVASSKPSNRSRPDDSLALDQLFQSFLRSSRAIGATDREVRDRIHRWLNSPLPARFLLIESEASLAEIVLTEIRSAGIHIPISHCSPDDAAMREKLSTAVVLSLPSKEERVRALLPLETAMLVLKVRSVATSLSPWLPAPADVLIAVASSWPPFLEIAKTFLISAGFSAEALVLRWTGEDRWHEGLNQVSAIVCDVCTATLLPASPQVIPYALLAEEALDDLREQVRNIFKATV